MNKKIAIHVFFLCSLALPLSAEASGLKYSQLVVFGDSLSDTGNVFAATENEFPPPSFGYFNGRFTNGFNWIDYLARDLGIANPTPIFNIRSNGALPSGGIDVAFGGATTESANTVSPLLPGLKGPTGQVSLFRSVSGFVDPDALYTFWYGANDYLPTTSPDFSPFTTADRTVNNIGDAITQLVALGAKSILIPNLPLLGSVPRANNRDPFFPPSVPSETAGRLNSLSQEHNKLLEAKIETLSDAFGNDVRLISLDIETLFERIIDRFNDDPSSSQFTNITDLCLLDPSCANPTTYPDNQYLFWDGIHPTTRAHQIIARSATRALGIPEGSLVWGIVAVGAIALRRKNSNK